VQRDAAAGAAADGVAAAAAAPPRSYVHWHARARRATFLSTARAEAELGCRPLSDKR